MTRKFEEAVCDSEWEKVDICVSLECLLKGDLSREKLLIVEYIGCSVLWIPVNLFPQPSLSLPNGLMNKVVMEGGMKVMHGLK